jgi:DNA-binding MarR family transcriptional regulator
MTANICRDEDHLNEPERETVGPEKDPILGHQIPDVASVIHVAVDRLHRIMRSEFDAFLKVTGDLKLAEWRVMAVLHGNGSMAQKDIIAAVVVEQAQVSRALASLNKAGLVLIRRGRKDKRVWLFSLSEKGKQLYETIKPLALARRARLDGVLGEEGNAEFFRMLRALADAALSGQNHTETDISTLEL